MIRSHLTPALLVSGAFAGCAHAQIAPLPLVASYPMELAGDKALDSGPLKLDLQVQNASVVPGKIGNALRFDGGNSFASGNAEPFKKLGARFSVTLWAKIERFPQNGGAYLVQKGGNAGWQFGVDNNKHAFMHGNWGGGWYGRTGDGTSFPSDTWTHVAFVMNKGERMRLYLNGEEVASDGAPFAFWPVNGDPFKIGSADFVGALDEVKVFATNLSPEQVKSDMNGQTPPTRAATDADYPAFGYPVRMALARFDAPIGFQSYDGRQKQTALRVGGPDAVDWPILHTEDGRKLFESDGQTDIEVPLVSGNQANPPIRQAWDHEIKPVNHWFRANEWLWDRKFVYTTDRTARTSSGDYEIWAFPIQIGEANAPAEARPIQKVELRLNGETIFQRTENLRSLTLLLPANLGGQPYELSINGGEAVKFDVGLKPLVAGSPSDVALPVDVALPGTTLRARLALSTQNPNAREWDDDQKAMANWKPAREEAAPTRGMRRFLGGPIPRAPLATFTASMLAGMSGGHKFSSPHTVAFEGTPAQYAEHLAGMGFDMAYDIAQPKDLDGDRDLQTWAREMEARGVRFGLNPTIPGNLDILGNPNLALLSTYLPEWGAPAYRDTQLLGARFRRYPNFGGLMLGADNAGYVSYWDWAATIPDRPWARAWEAHMKTQNKPLEVPVGPGLSPSKVFEKRGTQRQFLDYIAGYDKTFGRYGYFARALRDAAPGAALTTGSYGSSPGVGGRGGWPWATIPARPMNDGLSLLTAYDWNEQASSKPMHLEALLDRLQSEYPTRPVQALVDDFGLFMGRETRQRAYALALSRGVQAIGTTFLAHPRQAADKLASQNDQRELYAWIHRLSGAYSQLKLQPSVGIFYVHQQAISRPIEGNGNANDADLLRGSHEGKTTETLFWAQAAGFPAKIVTPNELKRGLDPSIKALLLVGLNRFDDTWLWSDGLEGELKKFVAAGGKLVRDDETAMPSGVTASAPGLQVRAYITQSGQDQTQNLLDRNADNISKLRVALAGVNVPLARSKDAQTWAVPSRAGDVDYLTLVNQATKQDPNSPVTDPKADKALIPAPRTASIEWRAKTGVIYDTRTQRRITPAQAAKVDFSHDAFQFLAVSPRAVSSPKVTLSPGKNGFWSAVISVAAPALRGVPVQLDITQNGETVSVYGASETPIALPLPSSEAASAQIVARENLSGQQSRVALQKPAQKIAVAAKSDASISAFWARKTVPLVIALTPAQMQSDLGARLQAFAKKAGRDAQVLPIESVVKSLQPTRAIQRFPQWQTENADLILLGSPTQNPLVFDQARGGLLDEGKAQQVTFSPFVGEKWVLNLRDETAMGSAQ